jgi:hypothetical protein
MRGVIGAAERKRVLARLRRICLSLPETSERLSDEVAPAKLVAAARGSES